MTNHWIDIANSDCILIMGSNAAETHPVSFRWVMKAKDKGGTLIHVDPRYTRTSTKADIYAPLRPGTDIAFLGGMIKYIIENKKYFLDYVIDYTNASYIVGEKYEFKDGLFSGFNAEKKAYDSSTWAYAMDEKGVPKKDLSLQDPHCVFQLMKNHYSRYDLDTVSSVTGTPKDDLMKVFAAFSSTGVPGKAGTIMYAMGWCQHSVGVQNIRTISIIQALLGNMGIAGGGVNALRGESNVQGSTDAGLLFHILPGYNPTPTAALPTLADYNKKYTPSSKDPLSANWWQNRPKYIVSMLKAFYGDAAKPDDDFAYNWLPKGDEGKYYGWLDLFDAMYNKQLKGFFAWGMNPACSGANSNKTREALANLEWMVSVNLFDNETASFWKGPGMKPGKIKTEVFFLPCATFLEKEGSISNSGRWAQWRYKAQEPEGMSKRDGDIIYQLFLQIRELYEKDKKAKFPNPILNLNWDYATDRKFDPHLVAKTINGYWTKDTAVGDKTFRKGEQVAAFAMLKDDGSTACGNWIYCQSYNQDGNNMARRDKTDYSGIGLYPKWSWAWPVNRRIIYNRASVDPAGKPWNPKRTVVEYIADIKDGKYLPGGTWKGDVPDGPWPPLRNPDGSAREDAKLAFIMKPDGYASLFGPGLKDGPFPEHYEPLECPVDKNPFGAQLTNPIAATLKSDKDSIMSCDPRFPFVGTTYRVSEHWQTGVITRHMPWLIEAEPQVFIEMSEQLARLKGISNGEKVIVQSPRGSLEVVAIVTKRLKPFTIQGQEVHMVGLPLHFGWIYPKNGGDSANLLTPSVGDPNTRIPESKAFMVNVLKKGA
jgi:formate dehydrogenase major subunit